MSFLGGRQLSVSRSCMNAIVLIVIGAEISRSPSAGRFPLRTHTHIICDTVPFSPRRRLTPSGPALAWALAFRSCAHRLTRHLFVAGAPAETAPCGGAGKAARALPGQRAPSQPQFRSVTFYSSSYFPLRFRPPDLYFFFNHYFNFFFPEAGKRMDIFPDAV